MAYTVPSIGLADISTSDTTNDQAQTIRYRILLDYLPRLTISDLYKKL